MNRALLAIVGLLTLLLVSASGAGVVEAIHLCGQNDPAFTDRAAFRVYTSRSAPFATANAILVSGLDLSPPPSQFDYFST